MADIAGRPETEVNKLLQEDTIVEFPTRRPVNMVLQGDGFARLKAKQDEFKALYEGFKPQIEVVDKKCREIMVLAQEQCAKLMGELDAISPLKAASQALWDEVYTLTNTTDAIPLEIDTSHEGAGMYLIKERHVQL